MEIYKEQKPEHFVGELGVTIHHKLSESRIAECIERLLISASDGDGDELHWCEQLRRYTQREVSDGR